MVLNHAIYVTYIKPDYSCIHIYEVWQVRFGKGVTFWIVILVRNMQKHFCEKLVS